MIKMIKNLRSNGDKFLHRFGAGFVFRIDPNQIFVNIWANSNIWANLQILQTCKLYTKSNQNILKIPK